ncbi:unnamed protein product [Rotaria sp. Silwood2]|nr:unnamed protein product [Rotaria sp. Silwood2]CAF4032026.1 unnamed protein product [Rotaria sp. Silwood2]CAF4165030.1 unnamed protein product [Rotaria sp. Silwood2]
MGPFHSKDGNRKHIYRDKNLTKTASIDESSIEMSPVVVWCDGSIDLTKNSDDDINTLVQLGRIVSKKRKLIHTFNDLNICQDFIKHVNNIFLIVSGQMGRELIPLVHDLDQIHSIYIFCMNKSTHESWAKQYKKILGVFTDIEEICEQLKRYFILQLSYEYEQLQFDILNKNFTLPTTDQQELPYIYIILSKLILSNMISIKQQDMINYCRTEYTSKYQLKIIDQFEQHYSEHNLIWWFTRDNFFQEIINRALQLNDLYTLCMMNPFIKELNNKLKQLQREQISSSPKILQLYFSQLLPNDDFVKLQLNQDGLICINEFVFANTERILPLTYIEHQDSKINTNYIKVLFKISISQTNESNCLYANIGTVSEFVHEKEYLLSMSSIFRIGKIEQLPDVPSILLVNLTLIDKNDKNLTDLTQFINVDQLRRNNDLSQISSIIRNELHQFKSLRKLLEQQFNSETKKIRPILLHYNMGIIFDCINEYEKALDEYKSAMNLTRKSGSNNYQKDNLYFIPLFSNMGLTYQNMNIPSHAFEHAFRALNILSNNRENSPYQSELFASVYFNLGSILHLQGKISEAYCYYKHALKSRSQYLSNDHPDVINIQNIITSLSTEENNLTL